MVKVESRRSASSHTMVLVRAPPPPRWIFWWSIPPVLMHVWKQKRSEWLLFVAMTKEGTKKINEEQELKLRITKNDQRKSRPHI